MPQSLFSKTFQWALAAIVIVDLLSLATFFSPLAFRLAFFALLVIVAILGFWKQEIALYAVVAEVFVGAQGRIFSTSIGGFSLSLRMGLFVVLLGLWLITFLRTRQLRLRKTPFFWSLFVLVAVIAVGVMSGILRGNDVQTVYLDANGWVFVLLALPVFHILTTKKRVGDILQILAASVVFLAFKTLILLAVFSHGYPFVPEIYRWVRDTRMFEIMSLAKNYFRIFSQAQVFSLVGFCLFGAAAIFSPGSLRNKRGLLFLIFCAVLTLIVSLSRSYWVAIGISAIVLLGFAGKKFWSWRAAWKVFFTGAIMGLFALLVISFTANYPFLYNAHGGKTAFRVLQDRTTETEDAAAVSRYALFRPLLTASLRHPILGSGFGTTITFHTQDPRTVKANGGIRTTYAFEWGYLDMALKVGLVGLCVIIWLLAIFVRETKTLLHADRDPSEKTLAIGLLFSVVSIAVTHALSPYLNHPTGLGFLVIACAIVFLLREGNKAQT